MRLARIAVGGDVRLAVVEGEGAAYRALPPDGPDPLLARLAAGRPLPGARDGEPVEGEVRLLAPIARPGKIVAVGLNYADHTAETGLAPPAEPLTFAKYPSSVVGPGDEIRVPADVTTSADWEAELALVIGTRCGPERRGGLADVAGWTCANDVSARDLQFRDEQWTRGKSLDTFCPLGPWLVTPDELGDPGALGISCTVDGAVMQDATTADLLFDVPALLDFITATATLEPGDVVLTGTPPGVGGFRTPPVYLADGGSVTVRIERIGELTNPVRFVRRAS